MCFMISPFPCPEFFGALCAFPWIHILAAAGLAKVEDLSSSQASRWSLRRLQSNLGHQNCPVLGSKQHGSLCT